MDIDRHLQHSDRIAFEDLDWEEARKAGLTADEVFVLTYFSDIESQTILYMRDVLGTRGSLDPDVLSFLTIWNYEEFYHGQALAKLLEACGHPLGRNRIAEVREKALFSETLNRFGAAAFSQLLPRDFITVYMTWGALNEITTLRGYEAIAETTKNPVLKELCCRIAKQERRHFAWYYNSAAERLKTSARTRFVTRWILGHVWTPVGAGVKKIGDTIRLFNLVFPGRRGDGVARDIDEKMRALPGLAGIKLMTAFARKASRNSTALLAVQSPANSL